jgi:hypothetical protein
LIVAALGNALLGAMQDAGREVALDGYRALKKVIVDRYGPKARVSIEQLELDPRSSAQRAAVAADLRSLGAGDDPELQQLAARLRAIVEDPMSQVDGLAPGSADRADPVEQAQRRAGTQVIGRVMGQHVATVMDARGQYMLDDTDLLSANISRKGSLPAAVCDEIAGLHGRIRDVIQQIAFRIEDGKYRDAEQAIAEMPLAYGERKRAAEIVQADKRMHVSYQSLQITVDVFSELNQMTLKSIERATSPQKEANMMLGNAIMIYELTDFVIRYIEGFVIDGTTDIERLHEETKRKIADLRRQQEALTKKAMAPGIEPAVRDQTLEDVRNREGAIEELDREWERYVGEVKQLHATVGEVRDKLQTLELIRDNARVQISLIQIVAMLQFLKRNTDAIRGTVDALKGFRLAPLSPNRVRRLLGIA